MAVALDPLSDLQQQLEQTAADPSLDPAERGIRLRDLRERINDVLGNADRLVSNVRQLREADRSEQARQVLWARENATLREQLIEEGDWTAEVLDEAGLLSHAELDRLDEEGLLIEAVVGIAKKVNVKFDTLKHPHGTGGRFSDTFQQPAAPHAGGGAPGGAPGAEGEHPIDPRFQHYFKDDPEATLAHVSRLRPTRNDTPEHIAKARANLDKAKAGLMMKRKPLDVTENGDGTLSIIDGNSTHAALSQEGLQHLPVKINRDVAPGGADDAAIARVADEMATKAEAAEPAVTAALKRVTTDKGGKLEGLDYRLKTRESLARKIKLKKEKYPGMEANEAGARILDSLRYTAVFPHEGYTEGVEATLDAAAKAGYQTVMRENYWGGGDDYDGFHTILRGPDGLDVELQFHTPESLATKEQKQHPIYEKFRASKDAHERWQLWQQMTANAAEIPQPPGADQLGGAKQHPTPINPDAQAKPPVSEKAKPDATLPVHKPDLVTGDVKEALVALAAGKHVELDHADRAGTLLAELHKQVKAAKAAGEAAPNIDLCKVSVKGENIFCVTHQGIPRLKMPQLKGKPAPGSPASKLKLDKDGEVDLTDQFREHLTSQGVAVTRGQTKASQLRASQRELNGPKVAAIAHQLDKGKSIRDTPLFTSKDDYIVDGHHRWAATVGHKGGHDTPMTTDKVDMGILELLHQTNEFTKKMGIAGQDASNKG